MTFLFSSYIMKKMKGEKNYESSILPALVERIKKEYKTEEFLITDILY